MGYFTFALTTMVVLIALATLLHMQFGRTGIVNFGIVGFVGLGMYSFGVPVVRYGFSYAAALVTAILVSGLVALLMGWVIRDLDGEATLVATLAFATIVFHLVTTEKWLTGGVAGLGTLPYPFDFGRSTPLAFLALVALITAGLMVYAWRLQVVPYGRLLVTINDNEPLSQSLGKPTRRERLVFFTVTSTMMGIIGALFASANQFLVPRMLGPSLTFTVWIALALGGRTRVLGGLVGVIVSVGLLDVLIERYAPMPRSYAHLLPDIKFMLLGMILVGIIMFRPLGILGERRTGSS